MDWRLPQKHHRGVCHGSTTCGVSSDSAPSDSACGRIKCVVERPSHNERFYRLLSYFALKLVVTGAGASRLSSSASWSALTGSIFFISRAASLA